MTVDVAIIGAGAAGLAAAARLAAAGRTVAVLEKNGRVGGKMGHLNRGPYHWDLGPSLLTMPEILEETWKAAGGEIDQDLERIRLPVTCRYFWQDGTVIDENEKFWSHPEIADLLTHAEGIREISDAAFLRHPPTRWARQILRPDAWKLLRHLPKVASPRSLSSLVRQRVENPRHRQMIERFATYNGSSPYLTPAAFAIIAQVQAEGGWYVRGGLAQIGTALANLAKKQGAEIRLRAEIVAVERMQGAYHLQPVRGEPIKAREVVCNQDALAASSGWLGGLLRSVGQNPRHPRHSADLSLSGFVLLLGLRKRFAQLEHHNIYFSNDYRTEFDELFTQGKPAGEPTLYIAASSRTEPSRAPADGDNWFVLVNAPPARPGLDWHAIADEYTERILDRLEEWMGEPVRPHVEVMEVRTPADFQTRDASLGGALYGYASHGPTSSFLRPPMKLRGLPGFHLVGGSTHPGGGVPLALLSGGIAARAILDA